MKLLALFVVALCGTVAAQTGNLKSLSARMDRGISAHTASGPVVIPARELLVEGAYPDGKPLLGSLLLFFDPTSGYYLWECSTYVAPFEHRSVPGRLPEHKLYLLNALDKYPTRQVVHLGPDGIAVFAAVIVDLRVRQSSQIAMNMGDAESEAIREATGQLQLLEGGQAYGWNSIRLSDKLGREFFGPKDSVVPLGFTIADVARKYKGWELVLKGEWKERLILTNRLDIASVERLD
jgi:hypothetical protein